MVGFCGVGQGDVAVGPVVYNPKEVDAQRNASGAQQWREASSAADPTAAPYYRVARVLVSSIVTCIWGSSNLGDQQLGIREHN